MMYQTIQQSLQKFRYMYTLSGMRLHEKRAPETSHIKYRAVFLFNYIWFNMDCLGTFSFLIIGIIKGLSLLELTFIAPCVTFSVLGMAKALTYTIYDKEAYQLVEDLIKLDASRIDASNSDLAKKIKATESGFLNKVINVLNVSSFLVMIMYNLGPLIGTAVAYFASRELKLFLPFLDVYPFDALDLKYWPYVYLHQIWSVCLILCYVSGVDCFLFTCCTYIRIQFRLMQLDIQDIIPDKDIRYRQVCGDVNLQKKLKDLICRHQEMIRLSGALRDIYSLPILFNVIASSFIICLTGFNATVMKEISLILPCAVFMVESLFQVFCLCYFGDLLMSSSEDVSEAVYMSRWYLVDKKNAKTLLIIMTRAQRPCTLTASGFMEVSLRAFMKILSTSWSYFALMKTMYEENE